MLIPQGECPPGTIQGACSGGTAEAFWMLAVGQPGGAGGFELDQTEMFGNDSNYHQAAIHVYAPATGTAQFIYAAYPYGGTPASDLTWDWHTVGMLITGSGTPGGTVCSYFDEVQLACKPLGQYAAPNQALKPNWSMMLQLGSGGGWPVLPPPSNQLDWFIDWVGVWH
jgi:hypothetical protein